MNFSNEFWVQIIIYVGSLGMIYGSIKTELKYMKEKLDKHNSFQDRLVRVEESSKSFHHRLDELKGEIG